METTLHSLLQGETCPHAFLTIEVFTIYTTLAEMAILAPTGLRTQKNVISSGTRPDPRCPTFANMTFSQWIFKIIYSPISIKDLRMNHAAIVFISLKSNCHITTALRRNSDNYFCHELRPLYVRCTLTTCNLQMYSIGEDR